ncbi:hypothetical protein D0Y65_035662 [Glycine soja]|uniref:Uncharacterized protein n=1 Tax=Glycine soja TaxID=3848 RepID=A0A445HAK5_GLYSO|nr:hypothetical protein D0Y65_035662 [Glycine soja]
MNEELLQYCQKEIKDLLDKGLIRKSKSPWSCAAFYVNKQSEIERGTPRLVINYKPLNQALQWIRKVVMAPKASGISLRGGRSTGKGARLALPEPTIKKSSTSSGSPTQAGKTEKTNQYPSLQRHAFVKWWTQFDSSKADPEQVKLWFQSHPEFLKAANPETSVFLNQKSHLAAFLAGSKSKEVLAKNLKEVLQMLQQEEEGSSSKKEETSSAEEEEEEDPFYQNEDDCFAIKVPVKTTCLVTNSQIVPVKTTGNYRS